MANLERQYIIPLRKEWLKVPMFKRAKKAGRAIKEFMAKHMKTDIENVRVGRWLNEQVWARGMKNPPHKIKVKAIKDDKGIVRVELFELSGRAKKIEEKESKRKSAIGEKKKVDEAKKKVEEEKANKETEALQKRENETKKEHQEKADEAQKINVDEEKLMKKETGHEHHHKPNVNLPHEKGQSKHPVRNVQEK